MAKRKISGTTKIEHTLGDLVYDWNYDWDNCRAGINAKDSTDAIAGNIGLIELYSDEYPAVVSWDPAASGGRTL
jgi:hypothetical protein